MSSTNLTSLTASIYHMQNAMLGDIQLFDADYHYGPIDQKNNKAITRLPELRLITDTYVRNFR